MWFAQYVSASPGRKAGNQAQIAQLVAQVACALGVPEGMLERHATGKRAQQPKMAVVRLVQAAHHAIDHAGLKSLVNDERGLAAASPDLAVPHSGAFQRAHDAGADRDDAPARASRLAHRPRG